MHESVRAAIIFALPGNLQRNHHHKSASSSNTQSSSKTPRKPWRTSWIKQKRETHNLLPQIPLANPPPLRLPTNTQQKPLLQPQIPFRLRLWRKRQVLAGVHARAVELEFSDAVGAGGFSLEGAVGGEVELREGVVAGADEAEEVGSLGEGVEEGGCADGGEEGGVSSGRLCGGGCGEEVEVC